MIHYGKKFIYVTFQRVGYHMYPDAPSEVSYLQDRHRHLFKFKVQIQVWHNEREIEFHMFLNRIESWYNEGTLELNSKSCETIADDLYEKLKEAYGSEHPRDLIIEVSEDGECGAVCHYQV